VPIITVIQEIGRIMVQDQSGQKDSKIPSQPTIRMWWCVSVVQAMQDVLGKEDHNLSTVLGKNVRHFLKKDN
jgi:hypothetical protein